MAYPPRYDRSYSFTAFQSGAPTQPLPAGSLDAQLDEIAAAVNAARAFIMSALTAEGTVPGPLPPGITPTGYAQGLLALADEAAWRTGLGFGVYFQSLRNAADAAAFRTLIGAAATSDIRTPSNRLVNPAMRVNQERAGAFVDVTNGTAYVVDQWVIQAANAPGGTLRGQQFAIATPGGSPNRIRVTAQAQDTVLAVNDLYSVEQPVEGQMVADAAFGTASAKQVILQMGVRSSIAGTFTVSLANSAVNQSWLGSFTIAAGEVGTDVVRSFVVPARTTGTWLTDAGVGMRLRVCLAAGATFQGVAGWQTGNAYAVAGQTNFMATAGSTFDLFDAGLYVDTAGFGQVPPFDLPRFDDDLQRCLRYYETSASPAPAGVFALNNGVSFGMAHPTANYRAQTPFQALKRAVPVVRVYDAAGTIDRVSHFIAAWTNGGVLGFGPTASVVGFYAGHNIAGSVETQFSWAADARI